MVVLRTIDQLNIQKGLKITKIILQFLISVAIFFASFHLLSGLDLMNLFRVKTLTSETDRKLGELILETYQIDDLVMEGDTVVNIVKEIFRELCDENDIDASRIRFLVVDKSEANAFTLPGRIIVVHKGLITESNSAEEVAGVIAHELAHLELGHIRQKLIREVGLQIILNSAGGSAGGEAIREIIYISSSRAFEREHETDADMFAVKLLAECRIDPAGLAEFLYRMADSSEEGPLSWISTHPGSEERSEYIMDERESYDMEFEPVYKGDWQELISSYDRDAPYYL